MSVLRNVFGLLSLVSVCLWGGDGLAAKRGVQFSASATTLTVPAAVPYSLDAHQFLLSAGTGNLSWALSSAKPAWLSIGKNTGIMAGNPALSDAGTTTFNLTVSDGESGAILQVTMKVQITPVWAQNPINLGKQPERTAWSYDVKPLITVPGGGAFTVSATGLPSWMSFNNGVLSGTPQRPNVGSYSGIVFTATATGTGGGSSSANAFGEVTKVPQAPKWVANPITIDDAREDFAYSKDIAGYVMNPEAVPMHFTLLSGPVSGWVSASDSGLLAGTPKKPDIGKTTLSVMVSIVVDGQTLTDITSLVFNVIHTNHAPTWTQNPITFSVPEEKVASLSVVSFAKDSDDGDVLTFTKVSGPAWATFTNGVFTGTPAMSDEGANQFVVKADDGKGGTANVNVTINVLHVNHAPKWTQNPIVLPDAPERAAYAQNIGALAVDVDAGDTKTIAKVSGPAWLTVGADGSLSGTPGRADVGANTMVVRVTDAAGAAADATVKINVTKVPRPPHWTQNPVALPDAHEDVPYVFSVAGLAVDDDGQGLTFKKISGPDWISVAAGGGLSGTPGKSDIGPFALVIQVSNGDMTADVNAQGQVIHTNHTPVIAAKIELTVKERATLVQDLNAFVTDSDGDKLTFALVDTADWVALSADGKLTLTPKYKDIGVKDFHFTVSDGGFTPTGTVKVTVVRDPRPPVWSENPIKFTTDYHKPFNANIASKVTDLDGLSVTITKKSGPAWLAVGVDGTLSGTPGPADLGEQTFVVTAANDKLGADTTVIITVSATPPTWTQNPIKLPDAPERSLYTQNLATYAKSPAGDALTFSKVSGPAWAAISAQGALSGTPLRADVGASTFVVRVTDEAGKSADVTVNLAVVKVPRPPHWTQNPIALPDAYEDKAFAFNVATLAVDDDGQPLTFTKVTGPAWLTLSPAGQLTGTPGKGDVGPVTAVFQVSNGDLTADVNANGRVIHTNHAPVINPAGLAFTVKERATVSSDLTSTVTDSDGDKLTFTLVDTPDYVKLASDGKLTLTPKYNDIGAHDVKFTVSDGTLSATGTMKITVKRDPRPPVWSENPIRLSATFKKPFSASILAKVTDLDGIALTIVKKDGPDWLTVAKNGTLSGTPGKNEVGDNTFTITAANDKLGADVTVIVTVVDPGPVWTQNPINLPDVKEGVAYSQSVASYATHASGDTLTFSKVDGAAWVTIGADGAVTGTPARPDVGANKVTVRVTDTVGKSADVVVGINVIKVLKPPYWVKNPIDLPSAKEGDAYAQDLAQYAKTDETGMTLTFAKVSGPAWAAVAANGAMTGTPARADVGANSWVVRVADQDGRSADVTVKLTVDKTPHPPKWTQNPLVLATAYEDKAYAFDVAPFATTDEGLPLTFSKVSGPAWLTLAPNGKITGTPGKADIGPVAAVFRVTDGILSADVSAQGLVLHTNHVPVVTPSLLVFTVKERETKIADLNIGVVDPDGDKLAFTLVDTADYIKLATDGQATLTPKYKDIGEHDYKFTVSDGTLSATGTFHVTVVRDPRPPVWSENPVRFTAYWGKAFTASLTTKVSDLDGLAIAFAKKDGPAWLTLDAKGNLSGTPGKDVLGENTFTVTASNDKLGADVKVIVTVIDAPPTWVQNPITLPNAKEGVAYNQSVASFAKDDPFDKLTFSKVDGPTWATVNPDGSITGTAARADVGVNTFTVRATDLAGLFADVTVKITVEKVLQPPKWTQNPITLPNAKEAVLYTQNISQYATSPEEGAVLTFTKVSGPAWAGVTSSGAITGTPARADVGLNTFAVRVSDQGGRFADTTVLINVEKVHHQPQWTQDPILLSDAYEDKPYTFNLKPFATTDEGLPLTFSLVSGPAWMKVAADGTITGTPVKSDVGIVKAVFAVSDGVVTVNVNGAGRVIHTNHPPTVSPAIAFTVKERATLTADMKIFASDPDGDALTFKMVDTVDYVALTTAGGLTLKPKYKDIGEHDYKFTVSDGQATVNGTFHVTVVRDPQLPVWTQNPIRMTAKVDKIFSADLSSYAKDLDGAPLKFTKKSGPDWLTVNANGTIAGTPTTPNLGDNTYLVSVANDGLSADATLIITVVDPFPAPFWVKNPIDLPDATEKKAYSQSLKEYAKVTGEGDQLTFAKVSGPAWAVIAADGTVTGTPQRADVGLNTFVVRVTNMGGKTADATVRINVIKVVTPPLWTQSPITLPDGLEDTTYAFDISPFAKDPEGRPLTFQLKPGTGPAWLFVGTDGKLTGVPMKADLGSFTATFIVSNGESTAEVVGNGKVLHKNHPPVLSQQVVTYEVKERATLADDLTKYVTDLDGDKLTFSVVNPPNWLALTGAGALTLKPLHADLGDHAYKLQVSDGTAIVEGTLVVKVLRDPQKPVWTQPIKLTANMGKAFSSNLSQYAKDLDGVPLAFTKVSGPAWATVSADGFISGTPQPGDLGDNVFVVNAMNDALGADGTVTITVLDPSKPPFWTINPIHLPDAVATKLYTQAFDAYAKSPDNLALTFSKLSGPDWAFIAPGGSVVGTPAKADIGVAQIGVRVTDTHGKFADVLIVINVVAPPYHAPKWTQIPLVLGETQVDRPFLFDLTKYVSNPDGLPLTYRIVKGPAWLGVSGAGIASGTPTTTDLGSYTATFEVTDGTTAVPNDGFGKVVPQGGHAPTIVPGSLAFVMKERQVLTVDLNSPTYVTNPDGNPLTFKVEPAPGWVVLTTAGVLTLKPLSPEVGDHTFQVTVTDAKQGLSGVGAMFVRVLSDPQSPYWTENPIRFTAVAGETFSQSIADRAKDPAGKPLSFIKGNGPIWMSVGIDGKLTGVPSLTDLGDNSFIVTAKNDTTGADVTVIVTVTKGKPPIWAENPIRFNAQVDTPFAQTVANKVTDPSGKPLTFSKNSGPTWLAVAPNGSIAGTPKTENLGENTFVVTATNGLASADVTVIINVTKVPPPVWAQSVIRFTTIVDQPFSQTVADKASDPQGRPLTFTKGTGPAWMSVATTGALSGTPTLPNLGDNTFIVTASNGAATADVTVIVTVTQGPPPAWVSDTIRMDAVVGLPFNNTLADKATSPTGKPLVFSKTAGPTWLTVGQAGVLSGTPPKVGVDTFTVTVSDGQTASATLIITVKPATSPIDDKLPIDQKVAGAPAENLWVIDNSDHSRRLMRAFLEHIDEYYADLAAAELHHSGIYLSSAADKFDGKPITGAKNQKLMLWSDADPAGDFRYRAKKSYVCDSCNSPVWSMHRFYEQLTQFTDIYKKGWFMTDVPMDVMIVTEQNDVYKSYAKKTQFKKDEAIDYAKRFIKLHEGEKKSYRISAIASAGSCDEQPDEDEQKDLLCEYPLNPYQTLVQATNGMYVPWNDDTDVEQAIHDYSSQVIFRAYVTAKKRIKLTKTPVGGKVEVFLAGKPLAAAAWTYNAAANEVSIDWSKIDLSKLKAGDLIEIKYEG